MAEAINHENPRNRRGGLSPREAADDLGVCVSTVYVLMGNRLHGLAVTSPPVGGRSSRSRCTPIRPGRGGV